MKERNDSIDTLAGPASAVGVWHKASDLAKPLGVHPRTLIRVFRDRPGVLRFVGPRGRETIRISDATLKAWINENSGGWQLGAGRGKRGAR